MSKDRENGNDNVELKVRFSKSNAKTHFVIFIALAAIYLLSMNKAIHTVCIALAITDFIAIVHSVFSVNSVEDKEDIKNEAKSDKKEKYINKPKPLQEEVTVKEDETPKEEPAPERNKKQEPEEHEMTNEDWQDFFSTLESENDT